MLNFPYNILIVKSYLFIKYFTCKWYKSFISSYICVIIFIIFYFIKMGSYYFDYMASTPCLPEVIQVMNDYLCSEQYSANPSSPHGYGQACQSALKLLEKEFLNIINGHHGRIIWTSGATEAINLALQGACRQYQHSGRHVLSVQTEHSATLETLHALGQEGFEVTLLPVNKDGLLDLSLLTKSIRSDTLIFSIMHVQNEIGVVQNIHDIANICYEHGILCHIDCAQTIGKSCPRLPDKVSLASYSGHKCYGPNGIGALFISDCPKRQIKKLLHGGNQQHNLRAGTIPLFLIAGFVKAVQLSHQYHTRHLEHFAQIRDLLFTKLHPKITWNGSVSSRAPQNIHITLPSADIDKIDELKTEFCLSGQSACQVTTSSHVLQSLGLDPLQQQHSLRIAVSHLTSLEDVCMLIDRINLIVSTSE